MEQLSDLQTFLDENMPFVQRAVSSILLSSTRIFAFFYLLPIFEKSAVPRLLQALIGLSLAAIVAPSVFAALSADPVTDRMSFVVLVLKEGLIGLLLAFPLAMSFWIIEAAGIIIDTQRGASMGSISDPVSSNESQPTAALIKFAFVCYVFVSGGLLAALDAVYDSYSLWPVLTFFPTFDIRGVAIFADMTGDLIKFGLILAGPIMLAMFLTEISLLYAARFAPQMNVFVLAMPAKSGIGYLFLCVYMVTLFKIMDGIMWREIDLMKRMLGLFS